MTCLNSGKSIELNCNFALTQILSTYIECMFLSLENQTINQVSNKVKDPSQNYTSLNFTISPNSQVSNIIAVLFESLCRFTFCEGMGEFPFCVCAYAVCTEYYVECVKEVLEDQGTKKAQVPTRKGGASALNKEQCSVNGVSIGLRVLEALLSTGDRAIHLKLFFAPLL